MVRLQCCQQCSAACRQRAAHQQVDISACVTACMLPLNLGLLTGSGQLGSGCLQLLLEHRHGLFAAAPACCTAQSQVWCLRLQRSTEGVHGRLTQGSGNICTWCD